jgi:hypothetical protein
VQSGRRLNTGEITMLFSRKLLKLGIIVGFSLLLLAPIATLFLNAQDTSAEPLPIVNISLTEYKFSVEGEADDQPLQLETGATYRIHFKNVGLFKHEVLIGSDPKIIQGGFKHDFENLLLSDVEVEISSSEDNPQFVIGVPGLNEFELAPQQELMVSFTLPEDKIGAWEMACFVSIDPNAPEDNPGEGHYDVGMHIPVNVIAGIVPNS